MFLKKLHLENFKCYKKATISFKKLTVIVGENNAGKSCLVESLRLVSKAAQNSRRKIYKSAPEELQLPATVKGFYIDTQKLKIDLRIIIYYYKSSDYAKIEAVFSNKSKIEIYLNQQYAFAVLYNGEGKIIKSKQQAEFVGFDSIGILPQIGPIRENEKLLGEETVKEDKDTYLSSLHFRNEILLWKDSYFEEFKLISESSWHGLSIKPIDYNFSESEYVNLWVMDNGFTAEIGKMGSGLQLWLQIMWFLARTNGCKLIILDEPDIYMHSDMQRKVLEIVKNRYEQVIIATHSLEIISRVDPENILEINKKDKTMHYATDSKSVQKIIDDIGGVQNLSLINLGRARKCLFVEGDEDIKYLNTLNEILFGKQLDIPIIPYGGFYKISQIYGVANLFYSETKNQIKCYALADKDFRDDRIIEKVKHNAEKEHLLLHIWDRKEIENYFIIPEVLFEFIPKEYNISYDKFLLQLEELLQHQYDDVFDSYAAQYRNDSKELCGEQWETSTCNKKAREYLNSHWNTLNDKISLVYGKNFFHSLSTFFKDKYKTYISITKVLKTIPSKLIPIEMKLFLENLN